MTARLTTQILVAVLRRLAESEGGMSAVLHTGQRDAGGLLVVLAERGVPLMRLERRTGWAGELSWDRTVVATESAEKREIGDGMLQRRISTDPDLWVVELDIADAERFAAQMDALG